MTQPFDALKRWPLITQIRRRDSQAFGDAAYSPRTRDLHSRIGDADEVVQTICPYCGVGCGQRAYVKDGKLTDIEGDPDSPISRGALCPKGAATFQLVTGAHRKHSVLYRRPHATEWEEISLERAMEMVAERVKTARDDNWVERDDDGHAVGHTLAFAHIGGATLDNEENYLIKKLFTALGAVQIENQARI